ncbi:LytR/AlgR family response regulator transcription factor [Dyadobacter luteus]|jgi:two-component system LytT family response regulator|nr:LytTR family DNA-binding domain-containing protein [Dyadobacter luteus]
MKTFTSVPLPGITASNSGATYVSVQSMGRTIFLSPDMITFMEGEGNYTYIYTTSGKKYLVSKTLKSLAMNLDSDFVRVHKSYLVNTKYVVERIEEERTLKMSCGKEVSISRRKMKEITGILDHADISATA